MAIEKTAVPQKLPSPVLEEVLGNSKMPCSRATKQLLGCSAVLLVALLSVALLSVVTMWTIHDSVPWMIPTRVMLDASEKADAVTLLIDAQVGTTDKALHVVRPRGGTCTFQGECGSESRGKCILLVATIQEFTYPNDSQMRFVAAVEQAWSSNIHAALGHNADSMVVSCELSIDINLFTMGYVITKQVQWHSKQMDAAKFLQLENGYANGARPRFRVKHMHTHKDGRIVQSKTLSNFSVAKHFIAELTLPLGSMVTALESTSIGVNAHICYHEAEMRAMEGYLLVNSNLEMARNTSTGEAVLSLPFHMLLRSDLPMLAKGAFQSSIRPGTLKKYGDMRQSTMERTMLLQASPGSRAAARILGDMHSIGWSSETRYMLKRNRLVPASFGAKMSPGGRRLISMFGIEDILGIELQNLATSHRLRIDDNTIIQVDLKLLEGPPIGASVEFNAKLSDVIVAAKASLTHHTVQETIEAKVSVLATNNGKVEIEQNLVASMDLKAENADAVMKLQMSDSVVAHLNATYRGKDQLALANVSLSGKDINATAKISGDFDDLIFLVDAKVENELVVKLDGREDVVKVNGSLLSGDARTLLMEYSRTDTAQDIEKFAVSMDMTETFSNASGKSNMTMSFSLDHGRRRTTGTGGLRKGLGRLTMTPTCQTAGLSGNAAMCTDKGETKSCCSDSLQSFMVSLIDNMTVGTPWATEGLTVQVADLAGTSEDMDMSAYLDINDKTMPVVEGMFRNVSGRNAVKCTLKENSTSVVFVGNTTWKELSAGYTSTFVVDGSPKDGQLMEGEVWFNGQWDGDIDVRFHVNENQSTELIRGIGDWNRKSPWGADLNATIFAKIDDKKEKIMALADISEDTAKDVRTLNANVKHNEKPVLSALVDVSDGDSGGARPCFVNATINEGENLAFLARAYGQITNPDYALDTLGNRQITLTHPIQGSFYLDIRDEGRLVTASTDVTKQDVSGGNVVKASVQATVSNDPIIVALNFATSDGVHMIVSGDVKVKSKTEASVSGTLKELGDWRQGDLTITVGSDNQILWARGSKGFLTQEMKPAGYDALWFNFGTKIGDDVKLNLTDLYFERGPDITWSGFGLKCQLFDKNASGWQELYQGNLDVDFVPGVAPVKQGNFAATNIEVAFKISDLSTMKMSDVIKSIAQASGVSASDVVVKTMKFKVTVTAAFDASVTMAQARSTIAAANNVQEPQVNVSEVPRRRLSAGWLTMDVLPSYVGRRLASRQLQSVITTSDATQAASVQTSAADTTKLTQALQQVVPSAPAPTITAAPSVTVQLATQVLSNSLTPVSAPSGSSLTQSLTQNLGQQVQAEVTNLGSSSCNAGVCGAAPGVVLQNIEHTSATAPLPSLAVLPLLLALLPVWAGPCSV
jgi:hypothetical protein